MINFVQCESSITQLIGILSVNSRLSFRIFDLSYDGTTIPHKRMHEILILYTKDPLPLHGTVGWSIVNSFHRYGDVTIGGKGLQN